MARTLHVLGLVLVYMGALIVPDAIVEAYEVVFSDDLTTDFAKGNIDPPGLIRQDWLSLPLVGYCGLAGKFNTPHTIDTCIVRGTFYTTFEYLTSDCTAEYKRDNNSCAALTSAFGACFNFLLDRRTTNRPWGYCSNFNFRVSYLWIANTTLTNGTTNSMPTSVLHLQSAPSPGSDWELPPVCSGLGCASRSSDSGALATIFKDIASLKKTTQVQGYGTSTGGRSDTGCDWRYSNLVPVAWDGIQNVLVAGQSLLSSDNQFAFTMQTDCNLVLYKKGPDGKLEWNAKWATYSQYNDPFSHDCSMELRPNGNLVVRDPFGKPRWSSGNSTSSLYSCALAVTRRGSVVVYEMSSGAVLWSAS